MKRSGDDEAPHCHCGTAHDRVRDSHVMGHQTSHLAKEKRAEKENIRLIQSDKERIVPAMIIIRKTEKVVVKTSSKQ